jgi:hypothetical protein
MPLFMVCAFVGNCLLLVGYLSTLIQLYKFHTVECSDVCERI